MLKVYTFGSPLCYTGFIMELTAHPRSQRIADEIHGCLLRNAHIELDKPIRFQYTRACRDHVTPFFEKLFNLDPWIDHTGIYIAVRNDDQVDVFRYRCPAGGRDWQCVLYAPEIDGLWPEPDDDCF